MKKIIILLNIICSIGIHTPANEIKISPELEAFMELKPLDPKRFEGNLYVGLMAFNLPQDNYIESAKLYFQQNEKLYAIDDFLPENQSKLKAVIAPYADQKITESSDYFPCYQYLDQNCIAETEHKKEYIRKIIKDNQIFLDRFQWLANNTTHNEAIIPNGISILLIDLPDYHSVFATYYLNLSEAILKINAGQAQQGIEQLVSVRKWIDITYNPSSNPTLIDLNGIIYLTQHLDQTMDALLTSGLLNNALNSPQLEFTLRPYSNKVGLIMQKSLIFELKNRFLNEYYPYVKAFSAAPNPNIKLSREDEYILLDYLHYQGITLSPNLEILLTTLAPIKSLANWQRVKQLEALKELLDKTSSRKISANIENLRHFFGYDEKAKHDKSTIDAFKKDYDERVDVLTNWYRHYFSQSDFSLKEGLVYLNHKYPSTEFLNDYYSALDSLDTTNKQGNLLDLPEIEKQLKANLLHSIDVLHVLPPIDDYTKRLYEQQNYHQLVYLKYLILKNKIAIGDIPAFLELQGDLAKNTITQAPYHFNAQMGTLSTPLPIEDKSLPISVRTAKSEDKSIQNFEVEIPKL